MSIRSNCDNCPSNPRLIVPLSDNGTQFEIVEKDQRIKELEATNLDLQSELARKKYSLSVACNRVEELEGKLSVAISALKKVDNIAYEIDNKDINDIACNALEQLGELK